MPRIGALREAFDRENALANAHRNLWAGFWIVVVLGSVVAVLGFYARLQLGGVGAALHAAGAPADFIAKLDGVTSGLGQWFINTGRQAAAKAEAAARAKLS